MRDWGGAVLTVVVLAVVFGGVLPGGGMVGWRSGFALIVWILIGAAGALILRAVWPKNRD